MLYTLVGNGNPNKKEVMSTLDSLLVADLQLRADEDFWMILVGPSEEQSAAYTAVVDWVIRNDIPFEYVHGDGGELPEWAESAYHIHYTKDSFRFSVKVTRGRPAEGEDRAMLLLAEEVEPEPSIVELLERAHEFDIPVYHLGGQMVQIVLEEDEPAQSLERPSPEEFSLKKSSDDDIEYTKEDLEGLTRDELKSLVQSRGVVPRDMRSKDALIDALMNGVQESVQEVEPQPEASFFLLVIDSDGKTEMRPLSAKQAALVA